MAATQRFLHKFILILACVGLATCLAACVPLTPAMHVSPIDVTRVPFTTQVYFLIDDDSPLHAMPTFKITLQDGRRTRTLTQEDWVASVFQGCYEAGLFQVASSGSLSMTLTVGNGQSQIAGGTYAVELANDRVYGIRLSVTNRDPTQGCFGCAGSRSFALDPGLGLPSDYRLWIVYGTNSISSPVVY